MEYKAELLMHLSTKRFASLPFTSRTTFNHDPTQVPSDQSENPARSVHKFARLFSRNLLGIQPE